MTSLLHYPKKSVLFYCLIICCASLNATAARAQQWYTGSLVSPAPAKDHAGDAGIEPYFTYSQPIGYYDAHGISHPQHPRQQLFSNSTMWKYGITDALSIQAHTVISYGWKKNAGHSTGPKFGDFPVDLIWRFVNANPKRYIPSLNLFAGVVFPTGDYSSLGHGQDGVGAGSYVFRTALMSQSTYKLPGNHNLRLRVWNWFRRALNAADVRDTSTYGTTTGFRGKGRPGMSGQTGFSLEYGINRQWLLAIDVARDWANGSRVWGHTKAGTFTDRTGAPSGDWQVAPAFEYNWNANWGIIAGASLYYAGHNTSIKIAPQFAINTVF